MSQRLESGMLESVIAAIVMAGISLGADFVLKPMRGGTPPSLGEGLLRAGLLSTAVFAFYYFTRNFRRGSSRDDDRDQPPSI